MSHTRTLRAGVGSRTLTAAWADGQLSLDGRTVEHDFARVSGGLYWLRLDGRSRSAVVEPLGDGRLRVTLDGRRFEVLVQDEKDLLLERFGLQAGADAAHREVRAPMPGLVLKVLASPGQAVQKGDGLVVLEAMKMENELRAPGDGLVRAVHVAPGAAVTKNQLLVEFEG